MGYILGVLLALTGGIFAFFFISEFSVFAANNLEWLAILLTVVGIAGFIGGVYIIYNMRKRIS
jgi:predicted MFS family arabinose efflux permease